MLQASCKHRASAAMSPSSAWMYGRGRKVARSRCFDGIWRNASTQPRRLITRRSQVQILPPLLHKAPETAPCAFRGPRHQGPYLLQGIEGSIKVGIVPAAVEHFDAAVIGAGIVGLAIAHELKSRGLAVCVLERSGIGAGASGVQPGGVRQQWATSVNCRLARESVDFYADASERLGSEVPFRLDRCGYLFLAHSPAELEQLGENVRIQAAEGVRSRLVTPQEIVDLVPGIEVSEVVGGAWCGDDGYIDRPQSVLAAFARGLDVRIEDVRQVAPHRGVWEAGSVFAPVVVVAAGLETTDLLRHLGIVVPIEPEARYLFLSGRIDERLLEPLVVSGGTGFAAKHLADGRVLASDLSARGDESGRERWRANIRREIERLLPRLAHVSFPTLVRGVYDVTPDHQPIVGPMPGQPGLFVASGFSGHGFMLAPAVARIVADAVTGQVLDPALTMFGSARFADGRLVPERQLV
jgi:sarcosine oxidase subunit beta